MGFTTGFTGGVTLTLSIAYLTVLAHERNRTSQALALRSQSRVLTSLLEPTPLPPPQSRADLAREERSTLVEAAKDRWNYEVENAVRWVQRTDWVDVRERAEDTVARVLGVGLERGREGVERGEGRIVEAVKEGSERAFKEAKRELEFAGEKAAELKSSVVAKSGRAKADAQSGTKDAVESVRRSGGTVDAAREALRGAVGAGIEKGKEVLGLSQAVGVVKDEKEAVERALRERYEKGDVLNKSVEEVLEERYRPIDNRDNTVLRGV
ncbi:hypothetical protein HYFRA_00009077 [Hymenoscyphus fraxineus]|uniref:MICOS complex subunit MIC12 n=1 Tax=Hymenoscyphus fraxineus TaxID=746836 RepID=A0A9N9PT00_9HELO|nr:hypothetical protein HYFRA_00009077 [Hymenoscyphus fraxineus]